MRATCRFRPRCGIKTWGVSSSDTYLHPYALFLEAQRHHCIATQGLGPRYGCGQTGRRNIHPTVSGLILIEVRPS
eukprot:scaffold18130_cov32-Tisochrysis_lutea.AAC.3